MNAKFAAPSLSVHNLDIQHPHDDKSHYHMYNTAIWRG